jgi:hypothetical protein
VGIRAAAGPGCGADERLVEEIVELIVGPQERLDALPQLFIVRTLVVQDDRAVRGVVIVCGHQEQGLHAFWVQRHEMRLRGSPTVRFYPTMRRSGPKLSKNLKKPRL